MAEGSAAKRRISVKVTGFRAPPSQEPVTGFELTTRSADSQLIDTVSGVISLQATKALKASTESVTVSADDNTVNARATLGLNVLNFNPLVPGCSLRITFPPEFKFDTQTQVAVKTMGGSLKAQPETSFDYTLKTLLVKQFNTNYLGQYQQSYFEISGAQNPSNVKPTRSFKVELLDPASQVIEYVDQGVTFEASTGSFRQVQLSLSTSEIGATNVAYTFTLEPQSPFTKDGVLEIVFPDQIQLDPVLLKLKSESALVSAEKATLKVQNQKSLVVSGAFQQGYPGQGVLSFTVQGVTNPSSSKPTASFQFKLYYVKEGL